MSVEDITKRIIDDAKREADRIIEEAQSSAVEIIEEAKAKAKEKNLQLIEQAKEEIILEQNKEIIKFRIDSRNNILQTKQNLLDSAYEKAHRSLLDMDEKSYRDFLTELIKNYVNQGEELIFAQKDIGLGKEIINSLNGDGENITVSTETRDISGGFISISGRIETNFSFKALIDNRRQETQSKLVEIMFR